MSNAVEMEIKLILDKRNQAKLLKQSLIKNAMREKEGKLLKLVSTYYDTRDYKLANTGMAYRVRKTGKAYEATVKTMGENIGGFSARGEYTVPLAKRKVVLKGFGTSFDKKLQTLLADDELQKLFDVEVNRTIYMLQITATTLVEMAIDEGEIKAEGAVAPISEIELELKEGKIEELFTFVAELSEQLPLFIENRSKFKRGLDLMAGTENTNSQLPAVPNLTKENNAEKEYKKLLEYYLGAVLVEQNKLLTNEGLAEADINMLPAWNAVMALWTLAEPLILEEDFKLQGKSLGELKQNLQSLALLHSYQADWQELGTLYPHEICPEQLNKPLEDREKTILKQLHKDIQNGVYTAVVFKLLAYLATTAWQGATYLQLDQFIDYRLKTLREEMAQYKVDIGNGEEQLEALESIAYGFVLLGAEVKTAKLNKATYNRINKLHQRIMAISTKAVVQDSLLALCQTAADDKLCGNGGILKGYRLALQARAWKKLAKLVVKKEVK